MSNALAQKEWHNILTFLSTFLSLLLWSRRLRILGENIRVQIVDCKIEKNDVYCAMYKLTKEVGEIFNFKLGSAFDCYIELVT